MRYHTLCIKALELAHIQIIHRRGDRVEHVSCISDASLRSPNPAWMQTLFPDSEHMHHVQLHIRFTLNPSRAPTWSRQGTDIPVHKTRLHIMQGMQTGVSGYLHHVGPSFWRTLDYFRNYFILPKFGESSILSI